MTQHASTGRFRRLSHTSQLRKHNSSIFDGDTSEIVKLPALRAINKSIKYNDLSFATHRGMDKLPKEPEQVNNIEEVSAHHSLVSMRKKYDNTNRQKEALQKRVRELEATRDELLAQKNGLSDGKDDGRNRVGELKGQLAGIKGLLDEGQMEKKVMLSMISRLKTDKVVYDLRKYNMEKELEQIHKEQRAIAKEQKEKAEEEDKTRKMFGKFIKHLENEKRERASHVGNVSNMLYNKEGSYEMGGLKQSSMMDIAATALQEKMPQEKSWQKVYCCHRFVECILRDKMAREMVKFNVVETAFQNIKTATGINTADELVQKYLTKEATYGDLLGKISDDQRQIAELKGQNQELVEEEKMLLREKQNLNASKIESTDLSQEEKEYELVSGKLSKCQGYYQRLKIYLGRAMKQFAQFEGGKKSTERTLPGDDARMETEEGKGTPEKEGKQEERELNMHSDLPEDNRFRHVSEHFRAYLQQINQNLRYEEVGEEGFDRRGLDAHENVRIAFGEEEERQPRLKTKLQSEPNEEGNFLDNQWSELHQHNEKFMREVRRRVEEEKRAKIEAEPKKKPVAESKPVAPPPLEE